MESLREETAEMNRLLWPIDTSKPTPHMNNEPMAPVSDSSKYSDPFSSIDRELLRELTEGVRGMRKELAGIAKRQEYQEQFCMELLELLKAENDRTVAHNLEISERLTVHSAEIANIKQQQESLDQKYSKLATNIHIWYQKNESSFKENRKLIQDIHAEVGKSQKQPNLKVPSSSQSQTAKEEKKVEKKAAPVQKPPIDKEIVGTWRMVSEENGKSYLKKANVAGISTETYSNDVKFVVDGDKLIWNTMKNGAPGEQFMDQIRLKTAQKECTQKKNRIRTVYKDALKGTELESVSRFTENGQLVITAQRGDVTCRRVYKRIG